MPLRNHLGLAELGSGCRRQVFQDTADDGRLLETFFLESWIEHLGQHQRVTYADQALELAVRKYVRQPPRVTHLIAASSGVGRSPSS
jgi:hypothetical protein